MTLRQDLRYAIRLLLKRPIFTLVVTANLALGIGANTAIFSVVNTVLLTPLPFNAPDRLVVFGEVNPEISPDPVKVSFPNLSDWQSQNQVLEGLAAYRDQRFILSGGPEPQRIDGQAVSPSFFSLLGVNAMHGSASLPDEREAQREQVVVLSYGFWQRSYGGDRDVLGRSIILDGAPYTIVGVMPPGFRFLQDVDVWTLLNVPAPMQKMRGARTLQVIGRVKAGVTLEQARASMAALARQLEQAYPDTNSGWGVSVELLQDKLVGQFGERLLILFGAVGFILLIACANTANLLLAQAVRQRREFAIRAALGARRRHLVSQSLITSLLLGLLGGGLGLLVAAWSLPPLLAMSAGSIPWVEQIRLDNAVLGFALAASLVSSLLCGLVPAVQVSRPDLNRLFKGEAGHPSPRLRWLGHQGVRGLLVASEIALAQVLLVGAGLLALSFINLSAVDLGFRPDNLMTMQISLPSYKYGGRQQQASFFTQLLERIGGLPGVRSVAMTNSLPLDGIDYKNSFAVEGRPAAETEWASVRTVSPDYFHTMGIPLLEGRSFTARDTADAPQVVVINQALARRFRPNESPVGKRVSFDDTPYLIIGVVGDVRETRLDAKETPEMYFSFFQAPQSSMSVVVRTDSAPGALAAPLRGVVQSMDSGQPVEKLQVMTDVVSRSVAQPRFTTILLGLFAVLALVLAVSGIYGVLSYMVSQRTREIGIRMALGARPDSLLRMVIGQGMLLVLIGTAIGFVTAFALAQYLSSLLFGVSSTDPATLLITSLLLACVAFLACYIPARRATKIDPITALRSE